MATVSGMFGSDHTYFIDSPVVVDIGGLTWPEDSPFKVVRCEVIYNGNVIGNFRAETGGQSSISFDVSSALRAIWADYDFTSNEVAQALSGGSCSRSFRPYSLQLYTEYIDNNGEYRVTDSGLFDAGRCGIGGMTEFERSTMGSKTDADMSSFEGTNTRNGDASTKPSSAERVGSTSITSRVDVGYNGTSCTYYKPGASGAPEVLRDTVPYQDFLFVNRRGAVETCCALMKEAESIDVETQQYSRVARPSFQPSRSLMAIAKGGRRSWSMSSGYVPREWAEWWAEEFLMARQWWMLYRYTTKTGASEKYVPVVVKPAKNSTGIYDRAKQEMPHVDFTVTMALEG